MRLRSTACRFGLICAALLGFACGEPAGPPQSSNPLLVPRLLAGVDSVLNTRLLVTEAALGLSFHPPRDGALVFADSLLGRTFEWDSLADLYVTGARTGAPNRGVRAILYAPDGFGTTPTRPYQELGHADVIHESPGTTRNLRTIVRDNSATVNGNYLVSAVIGTNAFEITSSGYFYADGKRLDIHARIAIDNVTTITDYTVSLPARDVWIHSLVTATLGANGTTAEATYILRHGSDVVDMTGTITQTSPTTSVADITLRLNGQTFAFISGATPNVTILDQDGHPMGPSMNLVVQRVFQSPDRLHVGIARVLQPAVNLLSGLSVLN